MALKQFSTKQIIFIALMAALLFALDLALVSGIDAAVGIPGTGVLVDSLLFVSIATIIGLTVRKFGTYTWLAFIYSVLTVPTNLLGPPGIYKLILGLILGLIADIVVIIFKYKKIGYILSLTIANTLLIPFMLFALKFLKLPGADELAKLLWFFIGIVVIESIIGAWIGIKLYDNKISKIKVVKQITSESV